MPENTSIRNMKRHEITAKLTDSDPTMLHSYAHYIAGKMQRAAQRRDLGWYEALRILGIITDTTARDAIRNIEREQVAA
ncbi:hypothetical protein [Citricoccus sp. K5]|uniref:hypothetical protein n=1 Tax=Citricoccus sp. K5 TaxID=2653135 RepID=UPI0012EFE2A9|nr:hypothetical protein [Citricoccus sp. K5]VXB24828.1 conserved hypothetical protein [Citricoccus sp. K5]